MGVKRVKIHSSFFPGINGILETCHSETCNGNKMAHKT